MRTAAYVCTLALLAATAIIGCGGHERTVVRRETVHTVPAPVIEKRTTTTVVPQPPVIEEHTRIEEY
jgi:hypothetical protein